MFYVNALPKQHNRVAFIEKKTIEVKVKKNLAGASQRPTVYGAFLKVSNSNKPDEQQGLL